MTDSRIGETVHDVLHDRDGVCMDVRYGQAYLRPEHGGREWTVPVESIQALPSARPDDSHFPPLELDPTELSGR